MKYQVDCWNCGGEGCFKDECECEAFVDQCCCLHPTPRRCSECRGWGWLITSRPDPYDYNAVPLDDVEDLIGDAP